MEDRKTADGSKHPARWELVVRGELSDRLSDRFALGFEMMDLKGGENGRTESWLGHICRFGKHECSRHMSSAGSAPRSNHSCVIVREEDATSGYPYGPKVPGGRRRRPDDS
jgi:hypothetical protein